LPINSEIAASYGWNTSHMLTWSPILGNIPHKSKAWGVDGLHKDVHSCTIYQWNNENQNQRLKDALMGTSKKYW
jgi:uncharacterized protein YfeS